MLKFVSTSQHYRDFLTSQHSLLSFSEQKQLKQNKRLRSALWRLRKLDLDAAVPYFLPLYSSRGRPARDPVILFRSFLLMLKMQCYSIGKWCDEVQSHREYQYVIGSWDFPGAVSHYDFINHLADEHPDLHTFFPKVNTTVTFA